MEATAADGVSMACEAGVVGAVDAVGVVGVVGAVGAVGTLATLYQEAAAGEAAMSAAG